MNIDHSIFRINGFRTSPRVSCEGKSKLLSWFRKLILGRRKPYLHIANNFSLIAGRMYAVIGKSGCGKTVLNSLFMGCPAFSLIRMQCDCEFFGSLIPQHAFTSRSNVEKAWRRIRKRGVLLYLPQQLPDGRGFEMSVREYYLQIVCALLKECRVKRTARDILSIFKVEGKDVSAVDTLQGLASMLTNKLSKPLNQLSGGERRRIELIARVYALRELPRNRQALLVLDEPTTGLDVPGVRDYLKALRSCFTSCVNGRVAILVTTHALHLLDDEESPVFDDVILVRKQENDTVVCNVSEPISLKELNRKWILQKYANSHNPWAAFLEEQASLTEESFLREKKRFLGVAEG